ncbi:MAG: Phosphoesterase [Chitinophagaceae bacterium]|nr:Phosphoesterase [Chitinophagaceae bacterium]
MSISIFKIITTAVLTTQLAFALQAQTGDTAKNSSLSMDSSGLKMNRPTAKVKDKLPIKPLLIPMAMIGLGFVSIENDGLKKLNAELEDEVYAENPHKKISIDNYLQFAPAAAVYGLNAMGIKGKHNLRDRSMIYLISNIILNATVYSVKKLSPELRPDSAGYSSFPSGHTAEAFASAEFMWQEYKGVSPAYGIAGYLLAAATGYLRMYNNKHWFTDVVAGAGIGMVSTKLAYWLYPKIQRRLFKDKPVNTLVLPTYQNGIFGVGMVHKF